jgi:hypothetical protein
MNKKNKRKKMKLIRKRKEIRGKEYENEKG